MGIIFGLSALGAFGVSGSAGAIPFLLISIILLPPSSKFIEEKSKIKLNKEWKTIIIIALLIMSSVGTHKAEKKWADKKWGQSIQAEKWRREQNDKDSN